jgi:MoaA/NifB/PqqE/SkfB family radical SAM enzyme
MTIETFKNALKYDDGYLSIGGGEPTLHPNIWEFIGLGLGNSEHLWMATNGKKTETALSLAQLARRGVMGVALSQDPWHSPINPKVVEAFTKNKKTAGDGDFREIRDVSKYGEPIFAGRCDWGAVGCPCGDLVVQPSGVVKACGCEDAPTFGNVNTEVNIPDEWMVGECWQYNKSEGVLDLEQYA